MASRRTVSLPVPRSDRLSRAVSQHAGRGIKRFAKPGHQCRSNHGFCRPLAIVTGASTDIGYELAKQCAGNGFDLLVAADEPAIHDAASDFRALGSGVEAVEADLRSIEGVEKLYAATRGRRIEALLANAGLRKPGPGFHEVWRVVDTNMVTETPESHSS